MIEPTNKTNHYRYITSICVIMLITILITSSCSKSESDSFIGGWNLVDTGIYFDFYKHGNYNFINTANLSDSYRDGQWYIDESGSIIMINDTEKTVFTFHIESKDKITLYNKDIPDMNLVRIP